MVKKLVLAVLAATTLAGAATAGTLRIQNFAWANLYIDDDRPHYRGQFRGNTSTGNVLSLDRNIKDVLLLGEIKEYDTFYTKNPTDQETIAPVGDQKVKICVGLAGYGCWDYYIPVEGTKTFHFSGSAFDGVKVAEL